jgi:tetratricopeptide (TPR) repeat protein
MALTEDLKNRLYLHLREADTVQQKIEFTKFLRENKELERVYYELKSAYDNYSPENYRAYLTQVLEEVNAADVADEEQVVIAEVRPVRPGWFERLAARLTSLLNGIPLPEILAGLPQPQLVRLATLAVVLLGIGWGITNWQANRYQSDLLENYGNAYGPTQGESDPDGCGNELKNRYYQLADSEEIARQNIARLADESISGACRSYYLGRSYLSLNEYDSAIQSFSQARRTDDSKIQEMATFDLALSYLAKGDRQKGLELLNRHLNWSEKKVVDGLKTWVE